MEKSYKTPPIAWLKVTDYMHGWVEYELGGAARIKDQRVISVQDIPGAREILRQEVVEDMMERKKVINTMSATRRNCIVAGMKISPDVIEEYYGLTKEQLDMFMPIECPKRCLTKFGVLRPWTLDIALSKDQASAMLRLLRQEFWKAVEEFNTEYSKKMEGEKYPAIEMIEEFCLKTKTPDIYIPAIRREWQRRVKNGNNKDVKAGGDARLVTLDDIS